MFKDDIACFLNKLKFPYKFLSRVIFIIQIHGILRLDITEKEVIFLPESAVILHDKLVNRFLVVLSPIRYTVNFDRQVGY